jgi:Cu2+-exporting ATPase
VTHESKDCYLSQVIKVAQDAQRSKSRTGLLADRAAKWLTIVALASALITFVVWLVLGKDLSFATERTITVLIICCPHALALAVPFVIGRTTLVAAKSGLLIKNRIAFEKSRKISTILINKTGTLTRGKFTVVAYDSLISTYTNDEILAVAAALEANAEHPIAGGIVRKAKQLNLPVPTAKDFRALPGKGVTALVDGKKISVVSPGFLKENKLHTDFVASTAETTVYVVVERRVAGFVSLSDEVRPEAREAIQILHDLNIKSLLLTGDNNYVAQNVSETLGMDGFVAEVFPHQKLEKVRELQEKGEFVAMTAHGLNNTAGLAEASVGIGVGWGPDVATETADIVLIKNNPRDVADAILFGKAAYRKIVENLVWAAGYNIVALPLAAGVLYNQGVLLSPAAGAVLTSLATIMVALNAQMLRMRQQTKGTPIILSSTSAPANRRRLPAWRR